MNAIGGEPHGVWWIVDLDAVDDADYTTYRPESTKFFSKVRGREVNETFLEVVRNFDGPDLSRELDRAGRKLRKRDRLALTLMWLEPLTLFPAQITNGGHRITEMRKQGLRWTVGYYLSDDERGLWGRDASEDPFS